MCRKLNITFIFLFLTVIAFGQLDSNHIRQTFYYGGSPKASCVYNKTSKIWSCTEYYINGKVLSNYYCDTNSYFPTGLKKTYDLYGDLAYIVNHKNDLLHGAFIEYFCNGKIKRRGTFYNNFRVGTWLDYYENGKPKSEQKFKISKSDSLYNWQNKYPDSSRVFPLIVKFGAFDNLAPLPKVKSCNPIATNLQSSCTDEMYGYDGNKTGTWRFFNKKGTIVKTEVYK